MKSKRASVRKKGSEHSGLITLNCKKIVNRLGKGMKCRTGMFEAMR